MTITSSDDVNVIGRRCQRKPYSSLSYARCTFRLASGGITATALLVQGFGNDRVLEKCLKRDDFEGRLVGRFEHDRAGGPRLDDLQPAAGADAPVVAGLEARESELRHGRGEIVAELRGDGEELGSDDAADGVYAAVVGAGVAAAVTIEAGKRIEAARLERLTEDVLLGGWLGLAAVHRLIVALESDGVRPRFQRGARRCCAAPVT